MRRPSFNPNTRAVQHAAELGSGLSRRAFLAGAAVFAAGSTVAFSVNLLNRTDQPVARPSGEQACLPRPPSTTIVVFDGSEPYTDLHKARALEAASEAATELPTGGRLVLAVMNAAEPENILFLQARCAPPQPDGSDWLQGSKHAERVRKEHFLGPVKREMEAAIGAAKHTVSPIMETIAAVTRTPQFDGKVERRRLVLVTDLLQNDRMPVRVEHKGRSKDRVGGYTQYSRLNIFDLYRRSRLYRKMRPDLNNVAVVVHYLVRPDAAEFQSVAHRRFWRDWFRQAGAITIEFRGIPAETDLSLL